MKAVILCAGYGTRLKPLTNYLPKPLFPIIGQPLIDNIIYQLKQLKISEICINTHHLAEHIKKYLLSNEPEGIPLQRGNKFEITFNISYEPKILGVAGGIANMRKWLQKEKMFIVHNGDILSNIDIKPAVEFHKKQKGLITLVLHNYKEFNKIILSGNEILSINKPQSPKALAFTGISIMSGKIFDFLPDNKKFGDILPVYNKLIELHSLKGYISTNHFWSDVGTPEAYLKAHKYIFPDCRQASSRNIKLFIKSPTDNIFIGKNSVVSPTAKLKGFISAGQNCKIKDGVTLENCIVWDNVTISKDTTWKNKIFYKNE